MSKINTTLLLLYTFMLISPAGFADPYEDWFIVGSPSAGFIDSKSGDIAVASDDSIHICYTDTDAYDLMYATNSSGSWVVETVDNAVTYSQGCSIDIDDNDAPHIATCEISNTDLIHAELVAGTWTLTTVDATSDCMKFSTGNNDIYVDSADYVYISYYDDTNDDLKYAKRNPGTGTWTTSTIDSTGDVGAINSISAHGSLPLYIAYADTTNYDIKLATYESGAWTTETVTAVTNSTNVYPKIAVGSDDTLHLVFGITSVEYNTLDIYGTWTNDEIDVSARIAYAIDIAVDDFNNVFIVYTDNDTETLSFMTNALGVWVEETIDSAVGPNETYDADLAMDSFGKVHATYYDNAADSYLYAHNTTGDTDSLAAVSGDYSSIGSDSDNMVYISTYEDFNDDLAFWTFTPGSGWSGETVDSTGSVGQYNSAVITGNGDKYIAYYDTTNTKIKLASKSSTATIWTKTTIDDSTSALIGNYGALAMDGTGNLHASYYDQTNGNLVYATNASGSWVAATVDSTGDVGKFTSIAVGDTNRVHICYYDQTNLRLRYAYKDSGSATWYPRTIGSDKGLYCDITTDGNDGDLPWISYYDADAADQNLRFVRISSTGSTFTSTVDSTGDVGLYTSIDTDDFNRPTISYYDNTNGNLKLARRDSIGTWDVRTISESGNVGGFTSINIDAHNHAHVAHQYISTGHLYHSYY